MPDAANHHSRPGRGWGVLLGAALVAATVLFVWRGPVRAVGLPQDFSLIYSSARAWLLGANPYDGAAAAAVWRAAGGAGEAFVTQQNSALLLYPPPSLALLAPFAAPPWGLAVGLWLGVNLASLAAATAAAGRAAELATRSAWLVLAAGVLAFGAVHTSLALGQTALLATAGVAGGAWALASGRRWLPGLAFGLAATLKPQLGLVFVAYLAWRRRWGELAAAIGVGAAMWIVGAGRLALADVAWLEALRANVTTFATLDAGRAAPDARLSHQLVNLHMLLHRVLPEGLVGPGVWAAVAALVGAYVAADARARRGGARPDRLAELALLGVITLLLFYHRYYDAAVMVLALAWIVRAAVRGRWGWAAVAGLAFLPLMAPGPVAAQLLAARGVAPAWLTESAFWRLAVIPQHVWSLLAVGVVLVAARWRRGADAGRNVAEAASVTDGRGRTAAT